MPLFTLLFLLLFSCPAASTDTYYRWQDEHGNHHYGDTPPTHTANTQSLELKLQSPLYQVDKVIDGDTIVLQHLGKVRLLGINTPEVAHRDRRGEPFGREAQQRLRQLLSGKRVYLSFDQQRHDRFDRLLAHVTREDGTPINEQLLQEGLARALFLQPNMEQLENYFRLEAEARQEKRGIWSMPEYRIRPATQAGECVKQFCRLRGKVKRVEVKRHYTYLTLPGGLRVSIHHNQMPQFHKAGVDITQIKGQRVTIRGWVGSRNSTPYLRLQHPLQIQITPP